MAKAAIVTGAAQGIGKTIAISLLAQDYRVFLFDNDSDLGTETAKVLCERFGESAATFVCCDVGDTQQFDDAFNIVLGKCKHISIMVNNAGIADEYDIKRCISTNLIGALHGSNLAISNMRKDKGGHGGIIVNVSSMAAIMPHHILPTYCATKSGIVNFTLSWAKNPKCEDWGLTFLCLCPGFVDTHLVAEGASKTLDPATFEASKTALGLLPLEDVSVAFEKLLKERQNGSVLEVSKFRTGYISNPTVNNMQVVNTEVKNSVLP